LTGFSLRQRAFSEKSRDLMPVSLPEAPDAIGPGFSRHSATRIFGRGRHAFSEVEVKSKKLEGAERPRGEWIIASIIPTVGCRSDIAG
jgi:hypothetical protein